MLSVAKVESDRATYYLSTTAIGADHPGGLVEADGVWLGMEATALGLAGIAKPDAIRALLGGRSPVDGGPLLAGPDRRRLSAYDCTFSTPKSVSVLFALSRPEVTEQIRLAHDGAVRASLDYLERNGVCVRSVTADGRTRLTKGEGGVIAIGWLHRSSRAPDPHLHTHVLVANLARHPSGEWRPLDARDLYAELRTAGALFETHLRGDLTARLGLGWRELNGVWADVEGSDPRVLRTMSQRSVQIAAELSRSGLSGPAAARLMADVTRPPKDVGTPYVQLVEGWWRRAHDEGLSAGHLASMLGRTSGRLSDGHNWEASTLAAAASRSVDGAFTRRQLIQARCAAAPAGRDAGAVERDVDHLLASPAVLARGLTPPRPGLSLKRGGAPPGRRERCYTTAELVSTERRVVASVAERPFEVTAIAYLPGDRAQALDELSNAAGAWAADRRPVVAVAPGWRAAASIEAATGIETVSLGAVLPSSFAGSAAGRFAGSAAGGPSGTPQSLPAVLAGGVLVITDAQCFSAGVLEAALESSRSKSAAVVIVGPQRDFAQRSFLTGIAHAATGRLPIAPSGPDVAMRRRFGEIGAVVTTSLGAATSEAARRLRDAPAGSLLVVAGDHGVVKSLREQLPGSTGPSTVVHANDLDAGLRSASSTSVPGDAAQPKLLVIGGASALAVGAARLGKLDREHVIVMPSAGNLPDRDPTAQLEAVVARAAEACRPRYLTAELGAPRKDVSERAAWRSAAVAIELFRDRFGVTDPRNAYGLARDRGSDFERWVAEGEQVKANVRDRGLSADLGPSRGRRLELGR